MTFKELNLDEAILKAVSDMGFETPSEIQQKTIPILLNQTTDLVALAQTGTGKTAAFGFPLIQQIDLSDRSTQGLILAPTRELCLQISRELELYSKYVERLSIVAVYGGASISDQSRKLERGAQIVVATPGRMQDMINRGMVDISAIRYCILDEADEMLNMGFYQDMVSILSYTPKDKSTWLFSATMPKEISMIAKKFMDKPVEVTVGQRNQGNINIHHEYYVVSGRDRYLALKRLADFNPGIFSIVFCRTKRDAQHISEKLIEDGYNAAALHGDLSQNQRDMVMKGFRNNQIQLLVATDVAARGIDVENISHVINYQLPDDLETYVHRSGRTGRAGNTGVSMIILTKSELKNIKQLEKTVQKPFEQKAMPSGIEICEKQLYHLVEGIKKTDINHDIDPFLPGIYSLLENIDRDDLIKKMVAVEFTRFLNYYKNVKDIDSHDGEDYASKSEGASSSREVRYFINIGEKNGLDWRKLKDLLKDRLGLSQDDVFKADVMGTFSYFNTHRRLFDTVMTLNGAKVEGITIKVEETEVGKGSKKKSRSGDFQRDKSRFGDFDKKRDRFGSRETKNRKRW